MTAFHTYLIRSHGHSQVQQAARLYEARDASNVPDVSPRVHRIPIPAEPVVLIAREGDGKIELRQVAAEPGLRQAFGRERADSVVLGVNLLILNRQKLLDACSQDDCQSIARYS